VNTELMLPTWEAASKMRFDCENHFCQRAADGWLSVCSHGLVVCHQRIDSNNYQAVILHGESEAVLVIATRDYDLLNFNAEVIEWLDRVHEYEATCA